MDGSNNKSGLLGLYKTLKNQNRPEEDNEKYVFRYLENKARVMSVPLHGSFELTPLCNLDCKMCYVHLNNEQFHQNQLLSVESWKSLIDQAHAAGMLKALLTGGECLTYPGFDEIYLHLYNRGTAPSVLSNGILLDERRISFFKRYPPRFLQVTVYGSSDDAYERVTGKRVFKKVYHNLELVRNAGLPIMLSITPNAFMKRDMQSLIETVESLNIPYRVNSALKPPRENTGRKEEDLTDEEYVEFFKIQNEIRQLPIEKFEEIELPDENRTNGNVYGLRCGGGRSGFSITYDGSMCPCFSLHKIKAKPLEIGFQAAWQQINTAANNYVVPAECINCFYRSVCLTCPAIHVHAPSLGHCDPRICERTKKMIKAGIIPLPNRRK